MQNLPNNELLLWHLIFQTDLLPKIPVWIPTLKSPIIRPLPIPRRHPALDPRVTTVADLPSEGEIYILEVWGLDEMNFVVHDHFQEAFLVTDPAQEHAFCQRMRVECQVV